MNEAHAGERQTRRSADRPRVSWSKGTQTCPAPGHGAGFARTRNGMQHPQVTIRITLDRDVRRGARVPAAH